MRVPINWLSEYIKLPKKLSDLTDKLTMVGHMLDKQSLASYAGKIDTVIDLELRGNRADMVGIHGVAREVATILGSKLTLPPTSKLPKTDSKHSLIVAKSEIDNLVKRYMAIKLKVNVKPSPKWLIDRLEEYGIPSFNNVIDITNYVMVDTGHPMHAFDFSKIAGGKLILRMAKNGEKFETIQQGTTLTLSNQDLVIADQEIAQCLNIIGGLKSGVSEDTKEIILESAVYDAANCRRTGRRLNTLTEGGSRHEKHQDPNGVPFALERALYLLQEFADAKVEGLTSDYYPNAIKEWKISLEYDYLYSLSGLKIEKKQILEILKLLGFKIIKDTSKELTVNVPTFRTDVRLPEDLIEEIVRIYGYDKIPTKTLSLEIPKNITPNFIVQEDRLRQSAVSVGFDETISLSFIQEKYNKDHVALLNPPSPDNKYLRDSLFFNLLDSARKIINERGSQVQLFEIGKVYSKIKGKYEEKRKIGFIYWSKNKTDFTSTEANLFIDFKTLATAFFDKAGLEQPNYISEILNFNFTNSYILKLNNRQIGFGGKHENLYYLEIDLDSILDLENKYQVKLWPKYPPQIEDITLKIPAKTYIGNVINFLLDNWTLLAKVELVDTFEDYYTFNVEYQLPEKTLTDKEVEEIRSKILSSLKSKFGISLKN